MSFSCFMLSFWTENISGAQYFVLEHKRNCLIALYPHLILWVRARTDSRVMGDFMGVL